MLDRIPVLFGPTGSGKSKLSYSYAHSTGAIILNMDSMQIYEGMDIGTAKPSKEDFKRAEHALFNITTIDRPFSVYDYQQEALRVIESNLGKKPLILVGGTGLYLSSLYYDFGFRSSEDPVELDKRAPIDWDNPHRVQRYRETGQVHPKENRVRSELPLDIYYLHREREELYSRIHDRVDAMIEEGLVDEVKSLLERYPLTEDSPLHKAIGYKEMLPFIYGKQSLEDCTKILKMNTRRYAKRQITWVKNQYSLVHPLDATVDPSLLIETMLNKGV